MPARTLDVGSATGRACSAAGQHGARPDGCTRSRAARRGPGVSRRRAVDPQVTAAVADRDPERARAERALAVAGGEHDAAHALAGPAPSTTHTQTGPAATTSSRDPLAPAPAPRPASARAAARRAVAGARRARRRAVRAPSPPLGSSSPVRPSTSRNAEERRATSSATPIPPRRRAHAARALRQPRAWA